MSTITLDARAPAAAPLIKTQDDKAMLRAAAELTRDLVAPRPAVYWGDLIASAATGYAALVGAVMLPGGWAVAAGVVVVTGSRATTGRVTQRRGLDARGLVGSDTLSMPHARLLLTLCLAAGRSREEVVDAFARY